MWIQPSLKLSHSIKQLGVFPNLETCHKSAAVAMLQNSRADAHTLICARVIIQHTSTVQWQEDWLPSANITLVLILTTACFLFWFWTFKSTLKEWFSSQPLQQTAEVPPMGSLNGVAVTGRGAHPAANSQWVVASKKNTRWNKAKRLVHAEEPDNPNTLATGLRPRSHRTRNTLQQA